MATKFKIRRKTMIIVSLIAGLSLMISISACFLAPDKFWISALFGLVFPVLVLLNFMIICYWIKYNLKFVFICLVPFVICSFFFSRIFNLNFSKQKEQGIKVMTWNVKCFDLYNWSMNKETAEKMMNLIKKENPDVLCLQEFYTDNNKFHNLEFIRDKLGFQYVHFYNTLTLRNSDKWGIATFSKYPIEKKQDLIFENSKHNACIITTIKIKNKNFDVFNTHLQSMHLGYDDYSYIEQVKSNIKLSNFEKTKSIFRKVKKAYLNRADQIRKISKNMDKENLILCGDFNDISISYSYQLLSTGLKDAFIEKGSGFSRTMNMIIPYLRIDFILLSSHLQVNSYKRIKKNLSDHYPVIITLDE